MQRSVSELEAATGEKKGGGDISGVALIQWFHEEEINISLTFIIQLFH